MSPPRGDIAPSALVARLQEMPRPNERGLPFPRKDDDGNPVGTFAMWVLTQEEVDLCRADAERYATMLMKRKDEQVNQVAWDENFKSALLVEVLFRALREDGDLSKPLFRTPEEIRHLLSDEECVHLYEAYTAMQMRVGPLFRLLSAEELEEWIVLLAEGADHYPFELCSRGQLVALVLSFVSQMQALRTGKSSSGLASTDGAGTIPSASKTNQNEEG